MAELASRGDADEPARPGDTAERARPGDTGELTSPDARARDLATIRALRARVSELEALLDARTQAVVGMGARLAKAHDDSPSLAAVRIAELERELEQLRATKLLRYSAVPRRIYGRVRRFRAG
jgi:hypothetical protein